MHLESVVLRFYGPARSWSVSNSMANGRCIWQALIYDSMFRRVLGRCQIPWRMADVSGKCYFRILCSVVSWVGVNLQCEWQMHLESVDIRFYDPSCSWSVSTCFANGTCTWRTLICDSLFRRDLGRCQPALRMADVSGKCCVKIVFSVVAWVGVNLCGEWETYLESVDFRFFVPS